MSLNYNSRNIRCPRNSKNNDGSNCYCRHYPFKLYHGVASKSVLCCYARGACCYESNCGYDHIPANTVSKPCIFELNNRRCNDPSNCIFELSKHKNQSKPKKYEQVYRHDIIHSTRFPRSKKAIDQDFDFSPYTNKNNTNISIQNVNTHAPKSKTQLITNKANNSSNINNNNNNNNANANANVSVSKPKHTKPKFKMIANNEKRDGTELKPFEAESKEMESKNEIKWGKEEDTDSCMDEFDMDAMAGMIMDSDEMKQEADAEIERTRQQYEKRGLKMPFHEKIKIKRRIEEKYENMAKQLKENLKYALTVTQNNRKISQPNSVLNTKKFKENDDAVTKRKRKNMTMTMPTNESKAEDNRTNWHNDRPKQIRVGMVPSRKIVCNLGNQSVCSKDEACSENTFDNEMDNEYFSLDASLGFFDNDDA